MSSENDGDQGLVELQALAAIYGSDAEVCLEERAMTVHLPSAHATPRISLSIYLPPGYPLVSPPIVSSLVAVPDRIDTRLLAWASSFVEILFSPGQEVLFEFTSWLLSQRELFGEASDEIMDQEQDEGKDPEEEAECQEVRIPRSDLMPAVTYDAEEDRIQEISSKIVTGQPIVEKRSTFLAHCCRVENVAEVKLVIQALLRINKIRTASHPCIMAYRINKTTSDCDDDGEASAGSRLLHLLHLTEAEGVVVVVTRWFGGILLGPSRFGIINNAARKVLEDEGFIKPGGQKGKKGS